MKLWFLEALSDRLPNHDNPWCPWYYKAFAHVVRAETEEGAREIAHENGGAENLYDQQPWKNPKYSTCVELTADGERGRVITDVHEA